MSACVSLNLPYIGVTSGNRSSDVSARILARIPWHLSVSASWNSSLTQHSSHNKFICPSQPLLHALDGVVAGANVNDLSSDASTWRLKSRAVKPYDVVDYATVLSSFPPFWPWVYRKGPSALRPDNNSILARPAFPPGGLYVLLASICF